MGCWVGADPGGEDSFGVALLDAGSGELEFATVSSVDEAVERIVSRGEPLGLGIDAPMWWSSDGGGRRKADERIRKRYGIHPGTVQSPNSLRGAALVGGAMLAFAGGLDAASHGAVAAGKPWGRPSGACPCDVA